MGWPVIGLWNDPSYDQTDVNSVCQSCNPDAGYVALGDDYGKVKLFRFPSPFCDPPFQACGGHASHVTKVHITVLPCPSHAFRVKQVCHMHITYAYTHLQGYNSDHGKWE